MAIEDLRKRIEREVIGARTGLTVAAIAPHYKRIKDHCNDYYDKNQHEGPAIKSLQEASLAVVSQYSSLVIANLISESYIQQTQQQNPQLTITK